VTSLPRPVLMAIVGAVAVVALFVVTRRGSEEVGVGPAPAPTTQPGEAPSTPASPGRESTTPAQPGTANEPAPSARSDRSPSKPDRGSRSQAKSNGARESRTLPVPVKRALDANKVVVLLFWNPKGSDDRSVKEAVDALPRRGGKVAVFTNTHDVSRYARITIPTNLRQTPTLVVVDPRGQARVATGYHDTASVEQYVVDALTR
jgi:hypothetical protein